jgi:hypothetical protein
MQNWRVGRPRQRWREGAVLAPLLLGRSSAAVALAAAIGFAVLILVLVVAVVALGAAFSRHAERRQACLQALQALVRAAPWPTRR